MRLAVRIGIHTGPVVVGTMGSGGRHEQLAWARRPTSRPGCRASPHPIRWRSATQRTGWYRGIFAATTSAAPVKGIETPLRVYRVVEENACSESPRCGRGHRADAPRGSGARGRSAAGALGTESRRAGAVVLLSGEAGIGKSRLVRVLAEQVADEGAPWLRCAVPRIIPTALSTP